MLTSAVLPRPAFEAWNEVRFEREFDRSSAGRNSHDTSTTAGSTDSVLEPFDTTIVARAIQEAVSTPLSLVSARQKNLQGYQDSAIWSSQDNVSPDHMHSSEVRQVTGNDNVIGSPESLPHSIVSNSTAGTSWTIVSDQVSLDVDPFRRDPQTPPSSANFANRNRPYKVGNIVNLDLIELSPQFELFEDPKHFIKKHRNDKAVFRAIALSLREMLENPHLILETYEEEGIDNAIHAMLLEDELERIENIRVLEEWNSLSVEVIKSSACLTNTLAHIFVGSSLFEAHNPSVERCSHDMHKIGNDFLGLDRYRMSANLTRDERFEKLLFEMRDTWEFSACLFIRDLDDPNAKVPGHPDISLMELFEAKCRRLTKGQGRPPLIMVGDRGRSVHLGFPKQTPLWYTGYASGDGENHFDLLGSYIPAKQNISDFGLGVFRMDPPVKKARKFESPSADSSSSSAAHFGSWRPSVFPNDRSSPREMPDLIGDEGNRFWPAHRAFRAIPEGHILRPVTDNTSRGLRLERAPYHHRWHQRLALDPLAVPDKRPWVATERHVEPSVPPITASVSYKHPLRKPASRLKEGKISVLGGIKEEEDDDASSEESGDYADSGAYSDDDDAAEACGTVDRSALLGTSFASRPDTRGYFEERLKS